MSQIDFNNLKTEHPELVPAVLEFGAWIQSHPTVRLFDPRRLIREMRTVDPSLIASLMLELSERGYLRQVYCVRDPNGTLITSEEYEAPDEVPEIVFGRLGESVPSSGRVATVFRNLVEQ